MLFRSHSNEIMSKVNENGHTGIAYFFFSLDYWAKLSRCVKLRHHCWHLAPQQEFRFPSLSCCHSATFSLSSMYENEDMLTQGCNSQNRIRSNFWSSKILLLEH